MEGFSYVDIFATKGIEYLLVIGFLVILIGFWRFLNKPAPTTSGVRRRMPGVGGWFRLSGGLFYHQGHTWAKPEGANAVLVGIDDFAQKLLGKPRSIELPRVGARVEQGEKGWRLQIDSRSIDVLSPIGGKVVAVNEAALRSPDLINEDPYEKGWLLKVEGPRIKAHLKNLLSGRLARMWMAQTEHALRDRMAGNLGAVLQDGGIPVQGIARNLSPDNWEEIASEFLLTK